MLQLTGRHVSRAMHLARMLMLPSSSGMWRFMLCFIRHLAR